MLGWEGVIVSDFSEGIMCVCISWGVIITDGRCWLKGSTRAVPEGRVCSELLYSGLIRLTGGDRGISRSSFCVALDGGSRGGCEVASRRVATLSSGACRLADFVMLWVSVCLSCLCRCLSS